MLRTILAISGKPGLYKLISQGKNMLIVESLLNGRRTPAYARDKVISLGDIAMYTLDEDKPLAEVMDALKKKTEGKPVDMKQFNDDADVRAYFKEVLPNFDEERVYTADIKKLFAWYNILLGAGITDFLEELKPANEVRAENEAEASADTASDAE